MPEPTENEPGQAIDDLTETVIASRVLHKGRYLTFRIDTVERADGSRAERDVAGHPGAVAILALDADGNVLLVRQYRSPAGAVLLEIPAGTLDVDPATGEVEDHALAARRELEEETGYRAGTWKHLTSFWTAPGFATELMHLWLATDLRLAEGERLGPDEDEHLRLERMPFLDAVAAAERGEIADGKSLVGLLWLDRLTLGDKATDTEAVGGDATPIESVRVSYRLGLMEYLGAIAVLGRASRGTRIFAIFMIGLSLVALFLGVEPPGWLPTLVIGILLLTGLFTVPFAWLAVRRRRDLVEVPVQVVIDATGLKTVTTYGESHVAWQLFVRVREVGDWFWFETGVGATHLLPKRALTPADIVTFRRIIAEAGFGMDGRRKLPKP